MVLVIKSHWSWYVHTKIQWIWGFDHIIKPNDHLYIYPVVLWLSELRKCLNNKAICTCKCLNLSFHFLFPFKFCKVLMTWQNWLITCLLNQRELCVCCFDHPLQFLIRQKFFFFLKKLIDWGKSFKSKMKAM